MRQIRALLAALVISTLVWTPAAVAKQYAPPGKAGTSEYAEDIPTAGGNTATPAMGGGNKTAAEINRLGAGKVGVRKLSKLGEIGAAAAQWAQQTAPAATSGASAGAQRGGGAQEQTARSTVLTASGGSALSALGHLVGGSDVDGIGALLPVLLAFGLGVAAAISVRRTWRRRHASA
ncbi:MAG: hypothetical protein ACRDNS_34405 [Trebonia sp.]